MFETENLYDIIVYIQSGNRENIITLLKKFEPILKNYSSKLCYEDAYYDLRLFFIELISKMDIKSLYNKSDGGIVKYIQMAIYNEYIRLCKNNKKLLFSEIYESENDIILNNIRYVDDHSDLLFSSIKEELTEKEYIIIRGLYYDGLTVKDLSNRINQTIWNVYKLRDSAIKKLKESFTNK